MAWNHFNQAMVVMSGAVKHADGLPPGIDGPPTANDIWQPRRNPAFTDKQMGYIFLLNSGMSFNFFRMLIQQFQYDRIAVF